MSFRWCQIDSGLRGKTVSRSTRVASDPIYRYVTWTKTSGHMEVERKNPLFVKEPPSSIHLTMSSSECLCPRAPGPYPQVRCLDPLAPTRSIFSGGRPGAPIHLRLNFRTPTWTFKWARRSCWKRHGTPGSGPRSPW